MVDTERPLLASVAVSLSVAHRAHVFFSYLRSSPIKAALSFTLAAPPTLFSTCNAKKVLEHVVLQGPDRSIACGVVLITRGRKRGIQTARRLTSRQPHLACKGSTKTICCGRVGAGLDTGIFTVNALH